uniref:SEA domain-containing protein n=1 Tax=Steinernema glaseri TaxID=37863 RepID=A0A1I7ZSF9_9BILA
MSLNGSGRYLRRFETRPSLGSQFEEDGESPRVAFEPGSGAEFMYNAGWHNRDPYGNERKPPGQGGHTPAVYADDEDTYGMKFWLIVALGIVTFLLLSLAIIMAILFGTRVFIVNPGEASTPLPVTGSIYDPVINRTFICEMRILNQANPAFVNPNSPEYSFARDMLTRGTNTMLSGSTLAVYKAVSTFENMRNV